MSADIVADLRALLASAGEKPPFLLVGHSPGGYYVRRYAELHPDEVTGLVLLDAVHEAIVWVARAASVVTEPSP